MDTKSVLLDLVKHTAGLGIIEQLKVTGNENSTQINAMDADRTVILSAKLHDHVSEFDGEFGMGNLSLLSSLTKLSDYAGDGATIKIVRQERNGIETPTTLVFEDTHGSKDQYRFMSKEIVDQVMKIGTFKGAAWGVEVQPSVLKVNQLSEVAGIYSGVEPTFTVKTEDNTLVFEVGSNEGGIVGRRVFAENIAGQLNSVWSYNLTTVLSILKLGLSGTCVIKFSDQGACQIDIDSGIGVYSYILPAISN